MLLCQSPVNSLVCTAVEPIRCDDAKGKPQGFVGTDGTHTWHKLEAMMLMMRQKVNITAKCPQACRERLLM